ncbi:hypothetical protein [Bacteroides sp. 51]|uniref:hypothetical protein n=1 Tax=Bacteroides sp. 51 TaxID=2302938 RepID=UPI0013D65557|nr:hypothetical protein [Bacteroides sp. 51]NDV83952.1 hypothetical protein [Bacteroides sp. 51]
MRKTEEEYLNNVLNSFAKLDAEAEEANVSGITYLQAYKNLIVSVCDLKTHINPSYAEKIDMFDKLYDTDKIEPKIMKLHLEGDKTALKSFLKTETQKMADFIKPILVQSLKK